MNIVIIGLGKVGQMLTHYLSNEGYNIVVIDQNSQKVENVVNQYDVLGISGNGPIFKSYKKRVLIKPMLLFQ